MREFILVKNLTSVPCVLMDVLIVDHWKNIWEFTNVMNKIWKIIFPEYTLVKAFMKEIHLLDKVYLRLVQHIKPFIDQIPIRYLQHLNENSIITEGLSSLTLKVEVFLRQIKAIFGWYFLIWPSSSHFSFFVKNDKLCRCRPCPNYPCYSCCRSWSCCPRRRGTVWKLQ